MSKYCNRILRVHSDGSSREPLLYDNYEDDLTDETEWSLLTDGHSGDMNIYPFFNAEIRTNSTITVQLSDNTADTITIDDTDSPYKFQQEMKDILITNIGTASVKIRTW